MPQHRIRPLKQLGRDNGLHGATTLTLDPVPTDQLETYLTDQRHRTGATDPGWATVIADLREHPN